MRSVSRIRHFFSRIFHLGETPQAEIARGERNEWMMMVAGWYLWSAKGTYRKQLRRLRLYLQLRVVLPGQINSTHLSTPKPPASTSAAPASWHCEGATSGPALCYRCKEIYKKETTFEVDRSMVREEEGRKKRFLLDVELRWEILEEAWAGQIQWWGTKTFGAHLRGLRHH